MKLREIRDDMYVYTGKASDIARQLCFSAIAVVWVFRVSGQPLAELLVWVAFFAIFSLALDLFQYLYLALVWAGVNWYHRKRGVELDDDVVVPPILAGLGWIPWFSKIATMIVAYIYLLAHLWNVLVQV